MKRFLPPQTGLDEVGHALAVLAVALVGAFAPAGAAAFVVPLAPVDEVVFVSRIDDLQIVSAFVDIEPAIRDQGWRVDVELVVRNVGVVDYSGQIGVLDEVGTTDATLVYVDGELTRSEAISPRQDPAIPEHTYSHVRAVRLAIPLGGEVPLRLRMHRSGGVDGYGRSFIELPTHALGLFADAVGAGRIRMRIGQRAIGLLSTIDATSVYDAPLNDATWTLRDWNPRVPFRVSWANSWAALLLVAEIEACPEPWRVVRSTTDGELDGLRRYVRAFDDPTLRFCANLPEVLHGRPFGSDRTRSQLAAMTLDRYIPGSDPVPLYVPNPGWSEALLSDAEAIYSRALRTMLSERNPEP